MIKKELQGLLGGIGAYASSLIYQKTLDYSKSKNHDKDYPNLLIYNLPCNHLIGEDYETKESIEEIDHGLNLLRSAGCSKILIACNSVHSFFDRLNNVKVVNWTDGFIDSTEANQILILGSEHTRKSRLYEKDNGKRIVYPSDSEQIEVNTMIIKAIRNQVSQTEISQLRRILSKYNKLTVALACTELSIVYSKINHKYSNVIDSCDYIAKELSK